MELPVTRPVTKKYVSPNKTVRMQDPRVLDEERTSLSAAWFGKLRAIQSKYNLVIAEPREKWDDTYASILPSGLPPDEWHNVSPKPTYYKGTETDTGLQHRELYSINPHPEWSQMQVRSDLQNNSSPPMQRFVHESTWQNKNKLGY
jgi:hypothetical protein